MAILSDIRHVWVELARSDILRPSRGIARTTSDERAGRVCLSPDLSATDRRGRPGLYRQASGSTGASRSATTWAAAPSSTALWVIRLEPLGWFAMRPLLTTYIGGPLPDKTPVLLYEVTFHDGIRLVDDRHRDRFVNRGGWARDRCVRHGASVDRTDRSPAWPPTVRPSAPWSTWPSI